MKNIILFLFLFLSFSTYSNVEERRDQLINVIDEELSEVTRLNKQIGARNPTLLLRMAELFLEKARLIKDRENYEYLILSSEDRQRTNKKAFFKKSNYYFVQAQKTCYYILKRFPRFKEKGDVYYVLAYNAREFQQDKKALAFFKKAVSIAPKNSMTNIKSRLLLAEMYYNQRKYKKSASLYESALKRKDQKWWTKDAFNLAWCYFRIGQKQRAISLMREIHSLSKSGKYINMTDQVERDLAFFYSDSGEQSEAVTFYKQIGKDISSNLLKMGKYLKSEGKLTSAEKTFGEALRNARSESEQIEIYMELLSLYEKFGRIDKHYKSSEFLVARYEKLSEDQKTDLLFQMQTVGVKLQKFVVSNFKRMKPSLLRNKAEYSVMYFKLLATVPNQKMHENYFNAGETAYAVKNYKDALELYEKAYDGAGQANDQKIVKLSLDGMMASLSNVKLNKDDEKRYLKKVYSAFLNRYPKGKKSYKVYQRLFGVAIEEKDIGSADKILSAFKSNYPDHLSKQEAMIAKIMDIYQEKGDRQGIHSWVKRINDGEFKISAAYARKVNQLLLTMQFENVEKLNNKGSKKQALIAYLAIFKDAGSSPQAKRNAAYNMTVIFHEAGNSKHSYEWAKKSLELMTSSEINHFSDTFLLIGRELFYKRQFEQSAYIYEESLKKVCRYKNKNKVSFFKNSTVLLISDNKLKEAVDNLSLAKSCNIPSSDLIDIELELIYHLANNGMWNSVESIFDSTTAAKNADPELIRAMSLMRNAYYESGQNQKARDMNNKINFYYEFNKKKNRKIPLESLDIVALNKIVDLKYLSNKLKEESLQFPEASYNRILKNKLSIIDKITTSAVSIMEIGSGKGIVSAYKVLISSYKYLSEEIDKFIPPGKGEDYVNSFKRSMSGLVTPLKAKAAEFSRQAKVKVYENIILSEDNLDVLFDNVNHELAKYSPLKNVTLMDRGGAK